MAPALPLGQVQGTPRSLLRLEGLLIALLCVWLFHRSGNSWWLFAGMIVAPDLSMLGYLAGPRVGAAVYNAGHTLAAPVLLTLIGLGTGNAALAAAAMAWGAHIGLDRALGYGLKYPTGFGETHLGAIGQARRVD